MSRRHTRPVLTPEQQEEAQRLRQALLEAATANLDELAELLTSKDDTNTLRGVDVSGRRAPLREAHRELLVYFDNQVHRMDDPSYRAKGWLIGSGPVEAACKQVVGQRLKGTGMRGGEAGADAVCHLRALFRSEKGQWDDYWRSQAA